MVEVKVAVDDDVYVARAEVVLGERVGGVAVDDLPLLDQLGGPAYPGVDQDRPRPRMLDHATVNRDVVDGIDAREMKPDDFHVAPTARMARLRTARKAAPRTRASR